MILWFLFGPSCKRFVSKRRRSIVRGRVLLFLLLIVSLYLPTHAEGGLLDRLLFWKGKEGPVVSPSKPRGPHTSQALPTAPSAVREIVNIEGEDINLGALRINLSEQISKDITLGVYSPPVGREKDLRKIMETLCADTQGSITLTGRAGSGKTSLAEYLAYAITKDEVPDCLRGKKVFSVNTASIEGGAKEKGGEARRLRALTEDAERNNAILFIDEVHILAKLDLLDQLKTAMSMSGTRFKLHTIGATTDEEYAKYFAKHSALVRRMPPYEIMPLILAETLVALHGRAAVFAQKYGVRTPVNLYNKIARLANYLITDTIMPGNTMIFLERAITSKLTNLAIRPDEVNSLKQEIQGIEIGLNSLRNLPMIDGRQKLWVSMRIKSLTEELKVKQERLALVSRMSDNTKLEYRRMREIRELISAAQLEIVRREKANAGFQRSELRNQDFAPILALRNKIDELELESRQLVTRLQADELTEDDLVHAAHLHYKVPLDEARAMVKEEELPIADRLKELVFGQDHLVNRIAEALGTRIWGAGLDTPVGVFLIAGPKRSGKKYIVETVADKYFGGCRILIDGASFMSDISVSDLEGTSKGYIGSDEEGYLHNIKRNPKCVIEFRNFDIAAKGVQDLIARLGEGKIQVRDEELDFSKAFIFLTTESDILPAGSDDAEVGLDVLKQGLQALTKTDSRGAEITAVSANLIAEIQEGFVVKAVAGIEFINILKNKLRNLEERLQTSFVGLSVSDDALVILARLIEDSEGIDADKVVKWLETKVRHFHTGGDSKGLKPRDGDMISVEPAESLSEATTPVNLDDLDRYLSLRVVQ